MEQSVTREHVDRRCVRIQQPRVWSQPQTRTITHLDDAVEACNLRPQRRDLALSLVSGHLCTKPPAT